ncbi:LPS export ABC transporter periplasmic protein LptC [Acinetobacter qingfengensis]|uniref:LPS export ABC transporter periplasmic protein LptC n=1 Tax=Acinetobacter qingfengensis TaxID=1262585 RepID=A0A1E7R6S4_9GAMM|nr:LPS export ABC transporter periplasmic protein LptC [Acinetobacter qingfengensis]KAA8734684.1 LPS export ABC transporter periplasmic protein LptC [Acinetobacter qingfengensis]OEY94953.1 LPS export ABC transporter periplasmic protein LptC [Acinetobacter qingfengensis]
MDTRLLYSIALAFVTVVGGFYYFSGKSKKLDTAANQNMNSTATNIHVTQTRGDGQLYAKAQANHLTQAMQSGRTEIDRLQGELFENGKTSATFFANKGIANNDYQDVQLVGNVTLNKVSDDKTPNITFKTDQLSGNTKTNQIETNSPVQVQSPQAQFTSQGLKGNLSTGYYEFFTIRGKYDPASR